MYLSVSELGLPEEVLIALTDDEGAGSVNANRAEASVISAGAVVDAALSKLYDVPFASPPELVKKLTRDLAVHELYARAGSLPDEVKSAHDEALELLGKVASGTFNLIGVDAPSPGFSYQDREFTREFMAGL